MSRRLLCLWVLLLTLVLQALPYGVTLRFGDPEGAERVASYSYFDPCPYGYGMLPPLPTAILTCLLMLGTLVGLFCRRAWLGRALHVCSAVTTVLSGTLFLYGWRYITPIAAGVTALLLIHTLLSAKEK